MLKLIDISPSDDENQRCQKVNRNFKTILTALTSSDTTYDLDKYVITQETRRQANELERVANINRYATKDEVEDLREEMNGIFVLTLDENYDLPEYMDANTYNRLMNGAFLVLDDSKKEVHHSIGRLYCFRTGGCFYFDLIIKGEGTDEGKVFMYSYKCFESGYNKTVCSWDIS